MNFCTISWDPPREVFRVPFIDHPVVWYGILFVTGFIIAYFVINPILVRFLIEEAKFTSPSDLEKVFGKPVDSPKKAAYWLTDRLCWFIVAGTVIGARLGEVFFYDWPYYSSHPSEIFKIWHGGLASHGGVLGVMTALYLFTFWIGKQIPSLTFLRLLDFVAIPSALVACFIRLGNFMNQEIIGTPTDMPWGVLFGHPADKGPSVPRHPVQLYEASAYLITFIILWRYWKKEPSPPKAGTIIGLMLLLIFGSRFLLEFWKSTQESWAQFSSLQMGQLLSIPFILLGFFLFLRSGRYSKS